MAINHEIIIAGFGGQGILSAGRIIAQAAMIEGKNVSWLPSYGPEMRGGTANCHVIVSEDPIGSPILNSANSLIVMNSPSLDKFEEIVIPDGNIIIDSSLISKCPNRIDVHIYKIPATKIASDMGNQTYANVVLLGKLIAITNVVSKQSIIESLRIILPEKKHYMIPDEIKALEIGIAYNNE